MSGALYTLDILRLAAGTGAFPRLSAPHATAEVGSKTCGSRIAVDVRLGKDGRVVAYGHDVHACAVGQAAATLVARAAIGRNHSELVTLTEQVRVYLTGEDRTNCRPDLDGIEALAPVAAYPARHGAALLAFDAAVAAVSQAVSLPA